MLNFKFRILNDLKAKQKIVFHKLSVFTGLSCLAFVIILLLFQLYQFSPRYTFIEHFFMGFKVGEPIYNRFFESGDYKLSPDKKSTLKLRSDNDSFNIEKMGNEISMPTLSIIFGNNYRFYFHKKPVSGITIKAWFTDMRHHEIVLPMIVSDSFKLQMLTKVELIDLLKNEIKDKKHFVSFADAPDADYKTFIFLLRGCFDFFILDYFV